MPMHAGFPGAWFADLHIHSKYSRACSKDCDLEHLAWWARRKGINLVGTGDFTHPAWYEHLRQTLVPAEPGLYRLKPEVERAVQRKLPPACQGETRFMLSVEISTIYKRDDRTRKVHHLIYFPDLDAVERFNTALGRIGNLGSDGRPILGLDSRDLLEITLQASPDGYLVPAHIWTPWFSALGSKSGFDAIADCYADLADHIFALETGLSSDPEMNWRVSSLDSYRLVSNSDAHSPPALGREATAFTGELDYFGVREALRTGEGFAGTIEFFPEEGKYHLDGHRKCQVRLEPADTNRHEGRCPDCGKPLTVGVLNRVDALADRPDGARPANAAPFANLVQLPQILGELHSVGPRSKTVDGKVVPLIAQLGPELRILTETPLDEITRVGGELLGEAIRRLRAGAVLREAGYDGEYGVVRLFEPRELTDRGDAALFDVPEPAALFELDGGQPAPARPKPTRRRAANRSEAGESTLEESQAAPADALKGLGVHEPVLTGMERLGTGLLDRLDPDQRAAASVTDGPLLIVAGPGTGKTRALTHRLAHLVAERGVPAHECLAITFTRRAAAEMAERLAFLLGDDANGMTVTTFHALGLSIVREHAGRLGLSSGVRVADDAERIEAVAEAAGLPPGDVTQAARKLLADLPEDLREGYVKELRARDLVDLDELVRLPVELLSDEPALVAEYRRRWPWLFVDEYQDVDATQYALLKLLAPPDGNICAIGDPDQAIYAFRGADVGFFLRFATDFPTARTVRLSRNYRSTAPILAAAMQVVAPVTLVADRVLTPVRRAASIGPRIGLYEAATPEEEADFVARTLDQLVGGTSLHALDSGRVDSRDADLGGVGFADIAVLYRTDAQARYVLDALSRAGVPVQKRSHDRLLDRPGVAAIAAELKYATGMDGAVAARVRLTGQVLADRPGELDPTDLHQAVDVLMPLAQRCGWDLPRFLTELATGAEVDTWDPRADRVTLLTLHASKGLEFPIVFLVGCEDGLLPLRLPGSAPDPAAEAEERRLFFVGITRAQDRLYFSHVQRRFRYGTEREMRRSPFVDAVDVRLTDRLNVAAERKPRAKQLRLI